MGASESSEIEKFRSKTFKITLDRAVVTLNELKTFSETSWEPINLVLNNGFLCTYILNRLEHSIELRSSYINLNKQNELILGLNLSNYVIWKFRASDPNSIQEWHDLLTISKRPRFQSSSSCQNCKRILFLKCIIAGSVEDQCVIHAHRLKYYWKTWDIRVRRECV